MTTDINALIDFFKKYTPDNELKGEMGEQDASTSSPAPSSGGGGGSIPKWADSYPIKIGKANPRMKSGEKWETGIDRAGPANKIW
jgi:hypothetical protein